MAVLLCWMLFAFILGGIQAQDNSEYCQISLQHTLCKFQRTGEKCNSLTARGVDERGRQIILQAHNSLRALIASGQETKGRPGPQPMASNMQIMIWDEELTMVAQRWADQCKFEHDCNQCRQVNRFPVGQNLGLETTTGPSRPPNWKKMVTKWYEEVEEFPSNETSNYQFSAVTGHFSQMVWAETNRVGCGFTSYTEKQPGTSTELRINYYVCNYGPAGNFLTMPVYRIGQPCSQCSTQSTCSAQFSSLCEPMKKPSAANDTSTSTSELTTTLPSTPSPSLAPSTASPASPEDVICQVGRAPCRAVFRGTIWAFKNELASAIQRYVETVIAGGETAELRLNRTLPAPPSAQVCMSIRMRHLVVNRGGSGRRSASSWKLPPLTIRIQPNNAPALAIPVETDGDGRWIQMRMTVSGIRASFQLVFRQEGPLSAGNGTVDTEMAPPPQVPAALRLAFEELQLKNGICP